MEGSRKLCTKCREEKLISEFHADRTRPDGKGMWCKACRSAWRNGDRERYNAESRARNLSIRAKNRQFVSEYLMSHPCVDCGESDIVVLEFDHVRGEKVDAVARMVGRACSIQRIADEIDKCEVRCANCHRRQTVKRRKENRNASVA